MTDESTNDNEGNATSGSKSGLAKFITTCRTKIIEVGEEFFYYFFPIVASWHQVWALQTGKVAPEQALEFTNEHQVKVFADEFQAVGLNTYNPGLPEGEIVDADVKLAGDEGQNDDYQEL